MQRDSRKGQRIFTGKKTVRSLNCSLSSSGLTVLVTGKFYLSNATCKQNYTALNPFLNKKNVNAKFGQGLNPQQSILDSYAKCFHN